MSSSYITIEQLRMVLDEKLSPLKSEIIDLRKKMSEFLDFANAKYEVIISKLNQSEAQSVQIGGGE